MKIYHVHIENFKGIKNLDFTLGGASVVCLIGRGDSCKSTILKAIELALSPRYKEEFFDSDFYNGDIEKNIKIKVTLGNLDPSLLSDDKYGLYIRLWDSENKKVIDDIDDSSKEKLITICLEIDKNLEPKWYLTTDRNPEVKMIYHKERALFKLSSLDEYTDKHFLWSKSSPLYMLLAKEDASINTKGLTDILRTIKASVQCSDQEQMNTVSENIKNKVLELSGNVSDLTTSIDLKDIMLKDSKFSLHDEAVPLKNKGKGTKKLISLSIQMLLLEDNGVSLIDEIEQGLEPDRVRHLVRKMKQLLSTHGQLFMTTHSRDTVTELNATDLYIVKNDSGKVTINNITSTYQDIVRKHPEVFFSKKIIICEGQTEEGICRAIDNASEPNPFSYYGVVVISSNGAPSCFDIAEKLNSMDYKTLVFCDSDKDVTDTSIVDKKSRLKSLNINIIDCDLGNSIEQQICNDLDWLYVIDLVKKAMALNNENNVFSLIKNLYSTLTSDISGWIDKPDLRNAIGQAAHQGNWFKNITKGTVLGELIINNLPDGKKITKNISEIQNWIKQNDNATTNP